MIALMRGYNPLRPSRYAVMSSSTHSATISECRVIRAAALVESLLTGLGVTRGVTLSSWLYEIVWNLLRRMLKGRSYLNSQNLTQVKNIIFKHLILFM